MPKAVPDGYHTITPYLAVSDASAAIAFYQRALGAKELECVRMPNGKVAHAEVQVGNSRLMLSDEMPEWGNRSAKSIGASPISLHVYVDNVDQLAERFTQAGGKVIRPLANQFYGDRSGLFEDPEGYRWNLSQHVEDVSPDELKRRMQKMG